MRQSISEGPFQTLHFNTPFQTFWTVHFRQSTSFNSFPTIHFRVRHTIHFKQCKYPLQSVIVSITVSQIAHYIHYKAHYTLSLQNSPLHYRQPISDSRLHSACYSLLHSACYRQPISDSPLHSACYRQPISDHPLQTVHYTQHVTDSPFQTVHYTQSVTDSPFQTVHYTQSVTDSPFKTIHYRQLIILSLLQTAHFRASISDSPLHSVCYRQTALLQIVHHSQYIKTVHFVAVNGPFPTVYYRQPITLLTTKSITVNEPFSDCSLRTLKVHHRHPPTGHYNPLQTVHCKIYSCRCPFQTVHCIH